MSIIDYLRKLDVIREREFLSAESLVRQLDICHNTFIRIRHAHHTCSMKTMKKIKTFVDNWEAKNKVIDIKTMSVKD